MHACNSLARSGNTEESNHESAHPLVARASKESDEYPEGGTSTCFCFGETASGKTYTLFGECGAVGGGSSSSPEGLYMMAARRIFDEAAEASSPGENGVLEPGFAGGLGVTFCE